MEQKQQQNNEQFGKQDTMQELTDNISYATMVLGGAKCALCESKIGETFKGRIPKVVKMHALMKAIGDLSVVDPNNQIDKDKLYKGITALAVWALETMDFETIFGRKGGNNADSTRTKNL
jgi:hypothetical protein